MSFIFKRLGGLKKSPSQHRRTISAPFNFTHPAHIGNEQATDEQTHKLIHSVTDEQIRKHAHSATLPRHLVSHQAKSFGEGSMKCDKHVGKNPGSAGSKVHGGAGSRVRGGASCSSCEWDVEIVEISDVSDEYEPPTRASSSHSRHREPSSSAHSSTTVGGEIRGETIDQDQQKSIDNRHVVDDRINISNAIDYSCHSDTSSNRTQTFEGSIPFVPSEHNNMTMSRDKTKTSSKKTEMNRSEVLSHDVTEINDVTETDISDNIILEDPPSSMFYISNQVDDSLSDVTLSSSASEGCRYLCVGICVLNVIKVNPSIDFLLLDILLNVICVLIYNKFLISNR